jgi:hypothetical protein
MTRSEYCRLQDRIIVYGIIGAFIAGVISWAVFISMEIVALFCGEENSWPSVLLFSLLIMRCEILAWRYYIWEREEDSYEYEFEDDA